MEIGVAGMAKDLMRGRTGGGAAPLVFCAGAPVAQDSVSREQKQSLGPKGAFGVSFGTFGKCAGDSQEFCLRTGQWALGAYALAA